MSLEELRERNKERVIRTALECFIENGIDKTRVGDIAVRAGLAERSVFRYFPTKTDIVVAAAFLYWNMALERTGEYLRAHSRPGATGIEEIESVLNGYSEMVFFDPDGIRFTLDAEVALSAAGKNHEVVNRPPERFETSSGPMAMAIRHGLRDGTVDAGVDVRELYYNSYDAILGVMQRITVGEWHRRSCSKAP